MAMTRLFALRTFVMAAVIFSLILMMPVTCPALDGPETKTIFPKDDTSITFFSGPWVRVNQNAPDVLYCYVKHKLLRSDDSGRNWKEIGEGLPDNQTVTDNRMGHNNLSFHPDPSLAGTLMLGGGQYGSWSGVPYRSDDYGKTWYPLNICEHGPGKDNQNFKYSASLTYGAFSPRPSSEKVVFGDFSTATCQGLWSSDNGGYTLVPQITCPYYYQETFCEASPPPNNPFCQDSSTHACSSYFKKADVGDNFLVSLNPIERPQILLGYFPDLLGWSTHDPYTCSPGSFEATTGEICRGKTILVDYGRDENGQEIGRFELTAPAFFMENGDMYAVNPAVNETIPAALASCPLRSPPDSPYEIDDSGALIFRKLTNADTCPPTASTNVFISNIQKVGHWLFFSDGYCLYSYPSASGTVVRHDGTCPPSSIDLILDFDIVENNDEFYVYYMKYNSDEDALFPKAELRYFHWAASEGEEPPQQSSPLMDFSNYWTGVRNFFVDDNELYVGSWDKKKFFLSIGGGDFSEVDTTSSLFASGANYHYLKQNSAQDSPEIISLFSGYAGKVELDLSRKPFGILSQDLEIFDWRFGQDNLCTTTFTSVVIDPKSPPGQLWVWFSSDAGIWRNKQFNCAPEKILSTKWVWPCWDHVSGGYLGETTTDYPIPSTSFGNYTYKLIFDSRDASQKTVYAATKSGLWRGIEQTTDHFVCQDNSYCEIRVSCLEYYDCRESDPNHPDDPLFDRCKKIEPFCLPEGEHRNCSSGGWGICGSDVNFTRVFYNGEEVRDVMVGGDRLYAITPKGIYAEFDFPPFWQKIYSGEVTAIDHYSQTPRKIVIAADDKLMYSDDMGFSWCDIFHLDQKELPVKQIAARNENGTDYLYFLTSNGYLRKTVAYDCGSIPDEPPGGLSVIASQPPDPPQINVSWAPVSSASSYNLYRSEDGAPLVLLAKPSSASYADLAVCRGKSYTYSVRANFTDQCYSYTSDPVTITVPTELLITNVQPSFGPKCGGTEVNIIGKGFTGVTSVFFGDTEATSFTWDPYTPDTLITAISPFHDLPENTPEAVHISVLINDPCASNKSAVEDRFEYFSCVITGIELATELVECPIPIKLTGCGLYDAIYQVFFDGIESFGIVRWDDHANAIAVPPFHEAGTVNITTESPCESFVPLQYTYIDTDPHIYSVSPNLLCPSKNEVVSIYGQGFNPATKFKIGGKEAPVIAFINSCMVTATAPLHDSGYADITASNPYSTFTLPAAVNYRGLEITGVSPQIIPADGAGHAVSVAFSWIGPPEPDNIHVLTDGIETAFTSGQNGTITLTLTYQESGYHSLAIAGADGCVLGAWPAGIISVKAGEIVVHPDQGTTAGGTQVDIYALPDSFQPWNMVGFYIKSPQCDGPGEMLNPESTQFISSSHIQVITPRAPEGCSDVKIKIGTSFNKTNGYFFKTFAFTTNWLSGDSTVIDTHTDLAQDLDGNLAGIQSMTLTGGSRPYGMALSSGFQPGRELYIADSATGGLLVLDASNLKSQQPVNLQYTDEDWIYNGFGAIDVAVDSTHYAYIAHLTSGKHPSGVPLPSPPWPPPVWNPAPGGISIVDLDGNTLVDADGDPATTSEGAPPGYSRVGINLYPFSISILNMERLQISYQVGDGYPGEYAVISGVGPQPLTLLGWDSINRPIYPSRPMRVGFIDLNPKVVSSLTPWSISDNPNYREYIGGEEVSYRGQTLGYSDQGLDFSISPDGQSATVYAVNPVESKLYYFDFLEAVRNPFSFTCNQVPLSCMAEGSPVPCGPTDVVVEGASAYVTNAAADSVAVCDISVAPVILAGSITYSGCPLPPPQDADNRYATAIDTRSDGSKAYTSDSGTNTVSVIDLAQSLCTKALGASDGVGNAPVRIAVQPVVTLADIARTTENALTFAQPQDFTAGPKQDNLKRNWENIEQLQETSASPQAVLSQINDFQNKVDLWVANADLKRDLVKCIDLYRVAYLRSHPLP